MRFDSLPPPSELAALLASRAGEVARTLTGTDPTSRTGQEWRFRTHGSLSVMVAGPKAGRFYDHEAGKGGGVLSLVQHLRGGTIMEACTWATAWMSLDGRARRPRPSVVRVPAQALARPSAVVGTVRAASSTLPLARRLWAEAGPARGTPAERYLNRRGLDLPADLPARFHDSCPRKDERLPALLWLLTDPLTGEPVGVQRVFLTDQGEKAPGVARMIAGNAGVIRLVPDEVVGTGLGIAEGAETALSVMQRFGWRPVWAAVSAGGIAAFPVLPGVEALTIWADADEPGREAATACAARWLDAGREAFARVPPAGDFNDMLREAV